VIKIKLPHEKFPELKGKKEKLDTYFDKLTKAGFDAVGNISMGMIDFFIIGVVKRSLDLVDGFVLTISNWNLISAAPIIRMHLDTLLRLNYISEWIWFENSAHSPIFEESDMFAEIMVSDISPHLA